MSQSAAELGININPPRARVKVSNNQAVADSSIYAVIFETEEFDFGDMWNPPFPTRLEVKVPGQYLFGVSMSFAASAVGVRTVTIWKNRTTQLAVVQQSASSAFETMLALSALADMVAGDYVEVMVFQTSGGPLNITPGAATPAVLWAMGLKV